MRSLDEPHPFSFALVVCQSSLNCQTCFLSGSSVSRLAEFAKHGCVRVMSLGCVVYSLSLYVHNGVIRITILVCIGEACVFRAAFRKTSRSYRRSLKNNPQTLPQSAPVQEVHASKRRYWFHSVVNLSKKCAWVRWCACALLRFCIAIAFAAAAVFPAWLVLYYLCFELHAFLQISLILSQSHIKSKNTG